MEKASEPDGAEMATVIVDDDMVKRVIGRLDDFSDPLSEEAVRAALDAAFAGDAAVKVEHRYSVMPSSADIVQPYNGAFSELYLAKP